MKNIKDRINTKLFKQEETVELSAEKVELSNSGQDFEKAFKAADKEAINMLNAIEIAEKQLEKAISAARKAESGYTDAYKYQIRVEKLFKEIGVPVTTRFESMFTEMKKNWNDISKRISKLENAKSSIS